MKKTHDERFGEMVDRYNRLIEPLENWATSDIVELIQILDCELQNRDGSEDDKREQDDFWHRAEEEDTSIGY